MAIFGFLLGSLLGFVAGFFGWALFGLSVMAAIGVYLIIGISTGLGLALLNMEDETPFPPTGLPMQGA